MTRGLFAGFAALVLCAGCAGEAHDAAPAPATGAGPGLPPSAKIEKLQTLRLVLHGDSETTSGGVSCASPRAGRSATYVQLDEDTTANVILQPMTGTAALHVTQVGTQRTWCAMTEHDGTGARIPANFEPGVYAIEVESATPKKQSYAVLFERL